MNNRSLCQNNPQLGSGCGADGRAVASNIRDSRSFRKDENKEKIGRKGPIIFLKIIHSHNAKVRRNWKETNDLKYSILSLLFQGRHGTNY